MKMYEKREVDLVKNIQGIYFLFDETKKLKYIGISKNIRKRLKNHFCTKKQIKYFRFSEIKDIVSLRLLEKYLINKNKPTLNPKYNPQADRTFNINGDLWHKFKVKVISEKRTIKEVLTELISWYINKKEVHTNEETKIQ